MDDKAGYFDSAPVRAHEFWTPSVRMENAVKQDHLKLYRTSFLWRSAEVVAVRHTDLDLTKQTKARLPSVSILKVDVKYSQAYSIRR